LPEPDSGISRDRLLGGRVTILQPAGGYRTAIDPILLAAAVPAQPGETILDAGSGTGAAALALAARIEGVHVVGLDLEPGFIGLAAKSAEESGLSQSIRFVEGDLLSPPADLTPGGFDHVMANPPYLAAASGNPSPDAARRAATVESGARLDDWLRFIMTMARAGGTVTVIHRYDRKDEVVEGLAKGAGGAKVFPLWPKKAGEGAKRVIIQARKGEAGKTRIAKGLVLHNDDGSYTPEAEAILRDAGPLTL
jgi:tRNA1(Val) A37 N6-methylase TrmN6|tara:strand:+ start:4553 stop:5305 length:753 start_codon:yes stop_codon:yes gene_type:complete